MQDMNALTDKTAKYIYSLLLQREATQEEINMLISKNKTVYDAVKSILHEDAIHDIYQIYPWERMQWDIETEPFSYFQTWASENDYLKYRAIELCADLINRNTISGNVCEIGLGVGCFFSIVTKVFPERTCYLYGTEEVNQSPILIQDNVVFRNGPFPASAGPESETGYVFVSLDIDNYDSVLKSLEFLWPRLSKGGYIFVQGYSVKKMIKTACDAFKKNAVSLAEFLLPDVEGTMVFSKAL